MKKYLMIAMALAFYAALLIPADAATIGGPPYNGSGNYKSWTMFSNWTGTVTTARKYNDVWDVRGWSRVTVQWNGITALGNYSSIAGTFVIYGGPTASGPWSPIYVGTTKLSYTADGAVTFDNHNNFICVEWNRTRNGIRGYLTVSEGR